MEQWRRFRDYVYEVSDLGNVRRTVSRTNAKAGAILRPQTAGAGYQQVTLCAGPVRDRFYIHHLVAELFLDHPPGKKGKGGFEINHKNADKADNRARNLEWTDRQGNVSHAVGYGLHAHGESHGRVKLKANEVREIRERYAAGEMGQVLLSRQYGVSPRTIWAIVTGKTWQHEPLCHNSKYGRSGEDHRSAKLTTEQVREIRQRYRDERISQAQLSREYGVTRSTVWTIVNNRGWHDV